jgi:hypothetical protein
MTPPIPKETLLLYISATTNVVSTVLVTEREEEGQAYPVQRPVYYVSEVLADAKIRYTQPQKLLYVLLITSRKHRHYFRAHKIMVPSSFPLGEIIRNRMFVQDLRKPSIKLLDPDNPEPPPNYQNSAPPRDVLMSKKEDDWCKHFIDFILDQLVPDDKTERERIT